MTIEPTTSKANRADDVIQTETSTPNERNPQLQVLIEAAAEGCEEAQAIINTLTYT